MKAMEFVGKDLDLAIESASAYFDLEADQLEIEVITEGEPGGLLGFGRKNAVIMAKPKTIEASEIEAVEFVEEVEEEAQEISPEELAENRQDAEEVAVEFLASILQKVGIHGRLTSFYKDDCLTIRIEGQGLGAVIGRRGETLNALDLLTSIVVNKGRQHYVSVSVDVGDYFERRRRRLSSDFRRIAQRVRRSKRSFAFDPMSPRERRIIHILVEHYPDLCTYSEGEDQDRFVIVALKDEQK